MQFYTRSLFYKLCLWCCSGLFGSFLPLVLPAQAQVQRLTLETDAMVADVTPDIGGRLLSVALPGEENFLRLGDAVISEPDPYVGPDADNIGYLGHEVWLGPQSQWWQQQLVNPARAAEKAVWPPDPYIILNRNHVVVSDEQQVVMRSPASPVSGVVLEKRFAIVQGKANQLQLTVVATNIRDTPVAWDLWFNTRVAPHTQVYVPVASAGDVRINQLEDETRGPILSQLEQGLFTLVAQPHSEKPGRRGKAFIQPSAGWLAAFRGDQLLIIRFPLQPLAAIHPEQGQVELYWDYLADDTADGLLELETHAPYLKLQPGEQMQAQQTWELRPYKGAATPQAQRAFLHKLELPGV